MNQVSWIILHAACLAMFMYMLVSFYGMQAGILGLGMLLSTLTIVMNVFIYAYNRGKSDGRDNQDL